MQERLGNHGIQDRLVRYGGHQEDLDYRITFSAKEDDGIGETGTYNYEVPMLLLSSEYQASVNDVITVQAGYSGGTYGSVGQVSAMTKPTTVIMETFAGITCLTSRMTN